MIKSKNTYRTTSTRLKHWDYGWNAAYFVTICAKKHECCFGNIAHDTMQLSHIGVLADVLWHEIQHHAAHATLGPFVVMPNHVHGVLFLNGGNGGNGGCRQGRRDSAEAAFDQAIVETRHALSLPRGTNLSGSYKQPTGPNRFQNQGKHTLSSIVGAYKSAVSRHAHRLGYPFAWQPRFYDHIIRDQQSFVKIADYIQTNPTRWAMDRFHKPHPPTRPA